MVAAGEGWVVGRLWVGMKDERLALLRDPVQYASVIRGVQSVRKEIEAKIFRSEYEISTA